MSGSAVISGILANSIAVVTGAGQGNGRAIAQGLAEAGARVVVTDLDGEMAQSTAEQIIEAGADAFAIELDVTDPHQCGAIAALVRSEIGPANILVNNAGILLRESIDSERAQEAWRKVLDVNLNGVFNVVHAWLPALRDTGGSIINIGSIASFVGVGEALGYSPSKGAVRLFTQALARDLAKDGIRVNAVAPGVIETAMSKTTRDDPARLATFMQRTPMGRVGRPEELVGPVVFLASNMASYVNGAVLPVDGGFLAT